MNLHSIVKGAVGAINPHVVATVQKSNGYTTSGSGKRSPAYLPAVEVTLQSQPLSSDDLRQLDGLNIQGEKRAMYIDGVYKGVVRPDMAGGDLITLGDGSQWLVVIQLEQWAGWAKVATVRQNS